MAFPRHVHVWGLASRAYQILLPFLLQGEGPLEQRRGSWLRLATAALRLHRLLGHELGPGEQGLLRLVGLVVTVAVPIVIVTAARRGWYSGESYLLPMGGYTVTIAPTNPRLAQRSSSLAPISTSSTFIMAMPLSRVGAASQNSASYCIGISPTGERSPLLRAIVVTHSRVVRHQMGPGGPGIVATC